MAAAILLVAPCVGVAVDAKADPSQPGAYCPLPEPGQKPTCLGEAEERYDAFFRDVDTAAPDALHAEPVERAVAAGPEHADAYLALSSLAYGYYRLSLRAQQSAESDPALAARLDRWNALLARTYATPGESRGAWRSAVREAATDLHEKAPPVALRCRDAAGEAAACTSTEQVLRALDLAAASHGPRGGLERLLRRIFGGSPE